MSRPEITRLRRRFGPVLAGAALLCAASAPLRADVEIGAPFPPLAMTGAKDGALPDLAGKVVLVDFWASWCAPCKASFPTYAKLQESYAARGFAVVAVSVDEKVAPYEAFVKKFAPPFIVVRDEKQALVTKVEVMAMPTCFLLGRDGRVRALHHGFHGDKTEETLRHEIEAALDEKISPPPS